MLESRLFSHSLCSDKKERLKSSIGLDVEVFSPLQKYRGEEAEGNKQLLREELER